MGLRARWTLLLLLFTLAVLGAVGLTVEWTLRAQVEGEEQRWRSGRRAELERELRRVADGAAARLQQALDDPGLESTLDNLAWAGASARRVAADWAPRQGRTLDLDVLLVFDPAGRLISAHSPWSTTAVDGPTKDFLLEALSFSPVLWRFGVGREGDPWFLGARSSLRVSGGRRFVILGGIELDDDLLVEIRERVGARSLHWGHPAPKEQVVALPLGWQFAPDARLAADLGHAPATDSLATVRRRLVPVGAGALLLGLILSPWLASTMARPLTRLSAAVDELGRGSRDLQLREEGPTELQSLASALNRLGADLDTAEDRMRSAERRAAWREIARRIAHEIRNSLSPLSLALDNVETASRREGPTSGVIPPSLETAREQLHSLERLVREFHEFARAPRLEMIRFDPQELCLSALEAARAAFPASTLTVGETQEPPLAVGDAEQLRRALVNLLKNAVEAAPHEPVELAWGRDEDSWWAAVRDRGPGIDPDIVRRLGEPYLTTREQGTGLGLPIVLQVVEGHGGELRWDRIEPRGWEMRMVLPQEAIALPFDAAPTAELPPPRGLSG